MGIDVYMRWDDQTKAEENAQYTGFSAVHGYVGYLREAYHGGPYATKVLVPEDWKSEDEGGVIISSEALRQRLPSVLNVAKERSRLVYNKLMADDDPVLQSFRDFVALHERLETEGKHPRIRVSR